MDSSFSLRTADTHDIPEILRLIKKLAVYERAGEDVTATHELLKDWLFVKKAAEVLLLEHAHAGVVGCAIFFQNFSTWTGKAGMYLEDLYIEETYRGSGAGRAIMAHLAKICKERGWARLDWSCLDWNEPSLVFYKRLGADAMTEWVHHRLSGDALNALADLAPSAATLNAAGSITANATPSAVGSATTSEKE